MDAERLDELQEVQETLGIELDDAELLDRALTHSSYANEQTVDCPGRDNEALEFLGDSVLGFVIASYLFKTYPEMTPGELSRIKSIVVSGDTLALTSRDLGVGRFLRLGRGEELSGGAERDSTLAALFESVVGAIYLDKGIERVEAFVLDALKEEVNRFEKAEHDPDYKSLLQRYAQEHFQCLPRYDVVNEYGPHHAKEFEMEVRIGDEIVGRGAGRSKKRAQQDAAADAWIKLDSENNRVK
ncbi:ribonuclease III [Candidatus Hydrogenedentota bacterium]